MFIVVRSHKQNTSHKSANCEQTEEENVGECIIFVDFSRIKNSLLRFYTSKFRSNHCLLKWTVTAL